MAATPKINKGIVFFSLIVLSVLILMSPLFSVKTLTIEGNERFSDGEIMTMGDVYEQMNIFLFLYRNPAKTLRQNHYIKSAEASVSLPDAATIDLIERKICGYVPYLGSYLYIDQDGYVMDAQPQTDDPCPTVVGLDFSEFAIGSNLTVENPASFDVVTTMSKLLLKYEFLDQIREINITDPEDIHFYVNNVDVSFGTIAEADKKIRIVIEAVKNIPAEDKGIFHIEDVDMSPYFTYTL